MKLLCVNGIPFRLQTGGLYTQVDSWRCCAKFGPGVVSVAESVGHLWPSIVCHHCRSEVPRSEMGWYNSARFAPWNPPHVSIDEVANLYQPSPHEVEA
jgi:hypothetical protein